MLTILPSRQRSVSLIGEGRGIGGIYISVLQRDNQVGFQLVVQLPLGCGHFHLVIDKNTLRHLQIVHGLHGYRDVGDTLVDLFLCSRSGNVGEHHTGGGVHGASLEIALPESSDKPAQPLPAVQDANLGPEVHETIGCGCAGQADPAFDKRAHLPQPLEPLALIILERRKLVDYHAVEVPA